MAKRQDRKDREDESRGMRRAGRFVEGNDPSIGRGEFAGLPKDVKMESYPRVGYGRADYLNDSIEGIDDIVEDSVRQRDRHVSNQK